LPGAAATVVGAPGGPAGVTALDGADGGPVPTALVAVTVNEYATPSVNPVTVIGLEPPDACAPPGDAVTVYEVIGEPFDAGVLKPTVAWPFPAVAVTPLGAPGVATFQATIAGSESAPAPSVARISGEPSTVTVTCAETVVTPVIADVTPTAQLPVPPETVQVLGVVKVPGPESIVNAIAVPSGAGCEPLPSQTFTCAVSIRVIPTSLVPLAAIRTFASSSSGEYSSAELRKELWATVPPVTSTRQSGNSTPGASHRAVCMLAVVTKPPRVRS
jgi:hypothetical protein